MRFILSGVSDYYGPLGEERDLQVCRKPGYLIAQTLGCNDGDFVADALVGLEIKGQFGIIAFDYDLCRFFDGLYEALAPLFTQWPSPKTASVSTREVERL
jgi:hypothetical protein